MAIPPEQKRSDAQASTEFFPPEFLPPAKLPADYGDTVGFDDLSSYINRTLLGTLPNDLTRMIYLASLRDCNSGMYLHPELSRQRGIQAADGGLRICHEQVFRRLLTTPLPEYVLQLQEYIRYTRSEVLTVLKTWKSLEAYRATAPIGALATSAELYFLNIAIALEIVGKQTLGDQESLMRRPSVG
jgi:hypothetical protein